MTKHTLERLAPQAKQQAQARVRDDLKEPHLPWVLTELQFGERVLMRDADEVVMSYYTEAEARAALKAWLDAMPMGMAKVNLAESVRVEHRP